MSRPDVTGRLQKWSIMLGEHNITYRPRTSINGQILADFLNEMPSNTLQSIPVAETQEEPWTLFTDGSSCVDGSGAGLILTNPDGVEFTYSLRFQFAASNNEAEYEALIAGLRIATQMGVKNIQANVDSKLVANQVLGTKRSDSSNRGRMSNLDDGISELLERSVNRVLIEYHNDGSLAMLTVDFSNAFNLVDRSELLHEVRVKRLSISLWVDFLYGHASSLYIGDTHIWSATEVQQGDTLGPLLLGILMLGPLLEIQKRPSSGVKLLGGVVSRDANLISGLDMRRASNAVDLMSLLPQLLMRPLSGRAGESQVPDSRNGLFHEVDRSKSGGNDYRRTVERANRSLGEGIKARLGEWNKNWVEELPHVLWAHRTMIKSSHGDAPFSLTYGIKAVIPAKIEMPTYHTTTVDVVNNDEELRLNLDLLEERRELAAMSEARSKSKMMKYYNSRVRGVAFKPGDFVYRSNDASHAVAGGKPGPKWEGPYEVTDALGNGAYKLRSMDGMMLLRTWNVTNLKRCYL
nr:reverse transcriptase domain-containing protein [Tanacetum cinerariifolium]